MNNIMRVESQIMLDELTRDYQPTSIVPFFFEGVLAGSEYLVADANKIYLALSILLASNSGTVSLSPSYAHFTDRVDSIIFRYLSSEILWSGADARYTPDTKEIKDLIFTRISEIVGFTHARIIGYKFTL